MFKPVLKDGSALQFPLQCEWLKINTCWPLETTNKKIIYAYKFWSYIIAVSFFMTIVWETLFLINIFGDILQTSENCCTTFMGVLNFIRFIHIKAMQGLFKKLISDFAQDIWIPEGTHPRIEADCRSSMYIFAGVSFMMSILIIMYCLPPLFILYMNPDIEEKPFPYKMIFLYDAQKGWRYVVTYFYTTCAGICCVSMLFSEDSIFGFFVIYTCGQLRLLQEDIRKIVPDTYQWIIDTYGRYDIPEEVIQNQYNQRLHKILQRQNKILKFAQNLEIFNSPHLLVNFLISSILICMVGFQLVTGEMFIRDYAKFLLYILSLLSQLFILCFNGNRLIEISTETAWHLYACRWEGGDLVIEKNGRKYSIQCLPAGKEFRLILKLMIMRSQRPLKITGMKMADLSLQSFASILRVSMSYFTLLQTLWEK